MMFQNLFRKPEPLREQAVRLIAIETAIDHGLDTEQAARVGHYAVVVLTREYSPTTALDALLSARQFARRLSTLESQIRRAARKYRLGAGPQFSKDQRPGPPAPEPVEVE